MPRTNAALVAVMMACALLGTRRVASAQPPPEEDRPRLVLNTLGPGSRTRAVAFSNDSARLFAAGFDKAVHVWDVGWNNQQGVAEPDVATPIQTLRWEIARADRGLINTMAVSPTAERIAIAGASARNAAGDIILIDIDRYEVEGCLPPSRNEQTSLPGHARSVISLNFSPDGRRLVSAASDGSVWLWTEQPGVRGNWTPTSIRQAEADPQDVKLFNERPVLFITNELFVVSEPVDPNVMDRWRLVLFSVSRPQAPISALSPEHVGRVSALARSDDGRLWASADSAGQLLLWTPGPQPTPRVMRHHDREPSSLSFGPGGRILAVSNYLDKRNQSVLELWETASGRLIDQVEVSRTEHTNTAAISPDGRFVATHADDTQDVIVYRLTGPDGGLPPDPLPNAEPTIRLHSRAHRVTNVAFKKPQPGGPPEYAIGFSAGADGQFLSEFNLSQPDLIRLAGPAPPDAYLTRDTFAGGWQVVPEPADPRGLVQLVFGGNVVDRIRLNTKRQGEYEGRYCLIPDAQGRPFAVALGTSNQNGIFVYSLPEQGRPRRLLRYFRDHSGEILSLGVSADGRYLVSGAEDQTIKVWSLAGLDALNPNFANTSLWGAELRLENGRVVVAGALKMGITFGRQLRDGDVITSLLVRRGTQNIEIADPQAILAELDLRNQAATEQFIVNYSRGGQPQPAVPIVPGWEPLMTLLVDARGEWALFTPEGYYDASIAEGQTLFGWQINRGRNYTPRFLAAETLQKDFERPDVLENILRAGSVFDALQANNEPVPDDFIGNIAAKAQSVPDIKIVEPLASQTFGPGQEITVKAEVTTAPGVDPNDFKVRATLGGRFIGDATEDDVARQPEPDGRTKRVVVFKTTPQDRLNRIQIVAVDNKEDSLLNAANNTATNFNRGRPPEPERLRKLHILALASDNYDGIHWDKLEYPLKDMDNIIAALKDRKRSAKFYRRGQVEELVNSGVTPQSVQSRIALIKQELSDVEPYDVVFVYLSGHGKAVDDLYYYVPPIRSNSDEDIRAKGISWTLLKGIADLKCNVIWMLDTCESGKILNKSGVREMSKLSMVLAASKKDAFEGDYRGGHGAFTASILDGLDGHADGIKASGEGIADDEVVTVAELVTYVMDAVYQNTGQIQEPVVSPTDLVDSPGTIKLAEVVSQTVSGP